jgi:hypothetical protein
MAEVNQTGDRDGSAPPSPPPFRRTRWTLAVLIVVVAAALTVAGLVKGMRPACQVTTVSHTGGSPGGTTTTRVCGMLNVTDYIYFLAIVGVLLLPDIKSLKIGGFEFERLTTEVAKQASEIGQLRQEISAVLNNTNNISLQVGDVARIAFADFRTYFRRQMDVLKKDVSLLPEDPQTVTSLKKLYDVEERIEADDLDPVELLDALQITYLLVAQVMAVSGAGGDTVVGAQRAEDVLPAILAGDPAGS